MLWADDEALKCPGCGHHRDESMAHGADQDYDAEAVVCHACAARDRAAEAWAKQENAESAGLMWRTYRKEG